MCSSTARVLPELSCRLQAHVFCWRVIGAAAPVMSCGVCPQGCGNSTAAPVRTRHGSGWDAQRATWILGKWSIGRERNQNNLAQERKRSRCAKCLIGYVVVWNMLVGHLFIYLAGTFFLSESYNFIYWSVPFQVHICICYRIWNILIIVLSQARLCCHGWTPFPLRVIYLYFIYWLVSFQVLIGT